MELKDIDWDVFRKQTESMLKESILNIKVNETLNTLALDMLKKFPKKDAPVRNNKGK